jgi:molybdopterin-guanine dinucleotide biosynthesis protein A
MTSAISPRDVLDKMKGTVGGCIIAGGQSLRMGGQAKMFLEVGGKRIIDRIIARLSPLVHELAINTRNQLAGIEKLGFAVVPDLRRDIGTPLAGLHAAINWAKLRGHEWVLTVPSDTPFLPADLLTALAMAGRSAAIAASSGQVHYLTGLWSASLVEPLEHAIATRGAIRVQDFAREAKAATVEWAVADYDPFFNVNTPEDLAEANRIAKEESS